MHRAPIVLTATALGLAATLGFQPHHAESAAPTATVAAASAPSPSSSSSSSSSSKTVTGDAVGTQYGDVQLKVTIADGKITDITPVRLPSDDPKSGEISSYAAPLLRQSALSRQSANVDAVSGATFTSNGYRAALQSALDKAGFQAAAGSPTA